MHEARQASVFNVFAPPLLGSAVAAHMAAWREVWMAHCVGLTLTTASLPVLVITLPVFPTSASKAGVPPADTPRWWQSDGQCKDFSSSWQVFLKDFFSTEIFHTSDYRRWLGHVLILVTRGHCCNADEFTKSGNLSNQPRGGCVKTH